MSTTKDRCTDSGFGIAESFLAVFLTLKLTGLINWSWWWVLSPIWIPLAIVLLLMVGGVAWIAATER